MMRPLHIIMPMAGEGSRFMKEGWTTPKPLIELHGIPLFMRAIGSVSVAGAAMKFSFIVRQEHIEHYHLEERLQAFAPGCIVVPIDTVTEGAACTVLLAEKWINTDDPMMIANSDQYVDIDINEYLSAMGSADGLIMTLFADDAKWSFIRYDENNFVTMVREKEVISNEATVGIYNYRRGRDFVSAAHQMIEQNIRVNGEFYVAPVYNEMIRNGKKIVFHNIGDHMYGLGIPEDLEAFVKMPISRRVFVD